jgi:hypothetical protein
MPQLLRILAAMVIGVLAGYGSIVLLAQISPDPIGILMEIIWTGILISAVSGLVLLRWSPAIPIRFSLRAILGVMTFVALALGIGMWLAS